MTVAVLNDPIWVLLISLVALWGSAWVGFAALRKRWPLEEDSRSDYQTIMAASLTILGLIIGFSFSMAITRYDQRKNYEEAEANAIGTEYVRADLLAPAAAAQVRSLLKEYLHQRILYYRTRHGPNLTDIETRTADLQARLWSAAAKSAEAQPTPITALVVGGMNDVLNSQSYTEAAWRNRIPAAAWLLMGLIAIICHLMIGYGAHGTKRGALRLFMLPPVVAISFFLIADIDSPRGGVIHVSPQNLDSLAATLR